MSMIARNDQGVTQWWSRKEMLGCPSPSDAKALAVLHGLHVAGRQGWSDIVLKTDCLPVHRYLVVESKYLISFGAIWTIACLFVLFSSLSFSFVRRLGNCLPTLLRLLRILIVMRVLSFPHI